MLGRLSVIACILIISQIAIINSFTIIVSPGFIAPTKIQSFRPSPLLPSSASSSSASLSSSSPTAATKLWSPQNNNRIRALFSTTAQEETPTPTQQEAPEKPLEEVEEDSIMNSPVFLTRKIELLKQEIKKAEEDTLLADSERQIAKEEWGPQMNRMQIEYDNVRARSYNLTSEVKSIATVQVMKEILPVFDNFLRAFLATPDIQSSAGLEIKRKYQKIYDDMMNLFEEIGVEEVKTVGEEFDYNQHEAIMRQPGSEYDEGIVCQEYQKGYKFGNSLIRPAMVAVAA